MTNDEGNTLEFYRSIESVRLTCNKVYDGRLESGKNETQYFHIDMDNMGKVRDNLIDIIGRDYKQLSDIPVHGRWQHLNCGGVDRIGQLLSAWEVEKVDSIEVCRRLVDLITFSVLIDAGAGSTWRFTEGENKIGRSEGLAVASFYMFESGSLSADGTHKVHGSKLSTFTKQDFDEAFQISSKNTLQGYEGRIELIKSLGRSLLSSSDIFGEDGRPGNMIDYLFKLNNSNELELPQVWDTLMSGYTKIWPAGRLSFNGEPLGDCWEYKKEDNTSFIVCFHKLTQWLCYSLLRPLEEFGHKFIIKSKDLQTGLPEYRNGGLFIDFGVLSLKEEYHKAGVNNSTEYGYDNSIPTFTPESGVIVEWRCLTIGLLDKLLPMVNEKLDATLKLSQLIEAGTWKAGREIAAKLRPKTGGPPINLHSDGTVF